MQFQLEMIADDHSERHPHVIRNGVVMKLSIITPMVQHVVSILDLSSRETILNDEWLTVINTVIYKLLACGLKNLCHYLPDSDRNLIPFFNIMLRRLIWLKIDNNLGKDSFFPKIFSSFFSLFEYLDCWNWWSCRNIFGYHKSRMFIDNIQFFQGLTFNLTFILNFSLALKTWRV